MPGIFGIITKTSNKQIPEHLINKMAKYLRHQEWYRYDKYCSDQVGIASISVANQPRIGNFANDAEGVVLALDGYIYTIDGIQVDSVQSITKKIANLYKKHKINFINKLHGNFSIVLYDKNINKLFLFNDRMGPRRLYYADLPEMFIFTPEIKAINFVTNIRDKINWPGIADFLNYGYVLGEDTFFEPVKSMPSASVISYEVSKNNFTKRKYWHPEFTQRDISIEEAAVEGLSVLKNSIREKLLYGNSFISPVSGGLDSRIIIGNLSELAEDSSILPLTYGQQSSYEYKNADKICKNLNFKNHILVEIKPDLLANEYKKSVWLTDGKSALTNSHLLLIPLTIGVKHDFLLNGIYGGPTNYSAEYYSRRHLNTDFDFDQKAADIKNVISLNAQYYDGIFNDSVKMPLAELAYSRIYEEFNKYVDISDRFCNQRDAFFIENRMRRGINQGSLHRFFWEEQLPLSNYDLYDFYLSLPPEIKIERQLLKAMLIKGYPQLAMIKDANSGLNLFEKPGFIYNQKNKIGKYIKYYISRLSRGKLSVYDKSNYAHYNIWIKNNKPTYSFFERNALLNNKHINDIFNKSRLKDLLVSVRNGGVGYVHLTRLTTLAIWYNFFVSENEQDVKEVQDSIKIRKD